MVALPKPLLLASIHDVSPRFENEVDRLLGLLRPHVGSRVAMLVVPNHWGSAPIVPGSPFARRLRDWADEGIEIFLHGFTHRDDSRHQEAGQRLRAKMMTASEGEFLGLSRSEAKRRIVDGRDLLEEVIGRTIDGFIAPAWLYGQGSLEALADCNIRVAEDHLRVWSPLTGQKLAGGPVITWASRTPARLASSLAAAAVLRNVPMRALRVGVHPPDINHPSLVRSIDRTMMLAAANRSASRYSDLLAA